MVLAYRASHRVVTVRPHQTQRDPSYRHKHPSGDGLFARKAISRSRKDDHKQVPPLSLPPKSKCHRSPSPSADVQAASLAVMWGQRVVSLSLTLSAEPCEQPGRRTGHHRRSNVRLLGHTPLPFVRSRPSVGVFNRTCGWGGELAGAVKGECGGYRHVSLIGSQCGLA